MATIEKCLRCILVSVSLNIIFMIQSYASEPTSAKQRIHYYVQASGDDDTIQFSTANPTIEIPLHQNEKKIGVARFHPNDYSGGDIRIVSDDNKEWFAVPWIWLLAEVGTVDLGEGDDIFFLERGGNGGGFITNYNLINPRKKASLNANFIWSARANTGETQISHNFNEPSLSRERDFLSKLAKEEGSGNLISINAGQDRLVKAIKEWHKTNPNIAEAVDHDTKWQFTSVSGSTPEWGIGSSCITAGAITYGIAGSPIKAVVAYDTKLNNYRVLYAGTDLKYSPQGMCQVNAPVSIIKMGPILTIDTFGFGSVFLDLETMKVRRKSAPMTGQSMNCDYQLSPNSQ